MNQHINQELMWKNQNLNSTTANGTSFDDKPYHGSDKANIDRATIKDYKNYNEMESGSFADGNYVQNRSYTSQSNIPKPQSFPGNCSSDPALSSNMMHQFDNNNDASLTKLRHSSDQPMTDEYLWYYLDPRGNVQGPFIDSQMFQWWSQGIYFQNSLFMKRKCDADFSTLQDYSKRFNGVPFNRKDIRVPPLTESLSASSGGHQFFANGPLPPQIHRPINHHPPINDTTYLLQQILASGSGPNTEHELSKMLHKVSLQQRIAPGQMAYDQSLGAGPAVSINQNGSDPFINPAGPSSLSNFVNLRLSNAGQSYSSASELSKSQSQTMATYTKNERYPASSWNQIQQPKLTDSVWMSTSDDTILSSNPVWSRSTTDAGGSGPSLLNSIFQDSQHKMSGTAVNQSHNKSNPMQDSWDNLDPAIIKIVPAGDSATHSFDPKSPKDNICHGVNNTTATATNQMDQRQYPTSHNNPQPPSLAQSTQSTARTHSDAIKYPWADLVRKGNGSGNNQKSKLGFSTEQDVGTNHSVSPHQHKTSLTSSSSDEYEHRSSDSSSNKDLESLIKWSKSYLDNKPGINNVDIGTLMELLMYVESPYEVEATMRENVPEFDSISDFVKVFVEKRRPLRQRLFPDSGKKVAPSVGVSAKASGAAVTVSASLSAATSMSAAAVASGGQSAAVAAPGDSGAQDEDSAKWQVKAARGHHGPGAAKKNRRTNNSKSSGKN